MDKNEFNSEVLTKDEFLKVYNLYEEQNLKLTK